MQNVTVLCCIVYVSLSLGPDLESNNRFCARTPSPSPPTRAPRLAAVATDNKGARDLCYREGPGTHTRHVDRKMFKMRELRGAGLVRVTLIPTDENEADIFTKPLDRAPFERHRDKIMNRASEYGVAKGQ